jgi:glycosyltransferase involved in cell wall biosynthesis
MKLSLYTFVRNGLAQDYHVVDMLRHHLPLADEIVVHEGHSTDGTYDAIRNLDPKITIFRTDWDAHSGMNFVVRFKDDARRRCTGDWCILLDCDEFIPEWEFDPIRARLATTDAVMIPATLLNFYGNYKVLNSDPDRFRWPKMKMLAHRNRPDVEVWGDGSSVRRRGLEFRMDEADSLFTCHHFGCVRNPARLREKWRNMRGRLYNAEQPRFRLPSFLFNLFPHDWADPEFLPYLRVYDGPYVKAVRDNPAEFVRDGLKLYKYLKKHPVPAPVA